MFGLSNNKKLDLNVICRHRHTVVPLSTDHVFFAFDVDWTAFKASGPMRRETRFKPFVRLCFFCLNEFGWLVGVLAKRGLFLNAF